MYAKIGGRDAEEVLRRPARRTCGFSAAVVRSLSFSYQCNVVAYNIDNNGSKHFQGFIIIHVSVWMWPCSNSNKRQRWSYNKQTGQLMNANGYCLDARQRMTTGGKVHMWTCMGGNKNQKWSMFTQPGVLDYYGSFRVMDSIYI